MKHFIAETLQFQAVKDASKRLYAECLFSAVEWSRLADEIKTYCGRNGTVATPLRIGSAYRWRRQYVPVGIKIYLFKKGA